MSVFSVVFTVAFTVALVLVFVNCKFLSCFSSTGPLKVVWKGTLMALSRSVGRGSKLTSPKKDTYLLASFRWNLDRDLLFRCERYFCMWASTGYSSSCSCFPATRSASLDSTGSTSDVVDDRGETSMDSCGRITLSYVTECRLLGSAELSLRILRNSSSCNKSLVSVILAICFGALAASRAEQPPA